MFNTGNYPKAKTDLSRSAELYKEAGIPASAARALVYLGITQLSRGEHEAIPVLLEAKAIAEKINDKYSLISCGGTLAEGLASVGRVEEAEQAAREGEQLARQAGNKMMLAVMLMQKGNMLNAIRQYERAEEAFKESLLFYEASGFKIYKAWANLGLAHAYRERKNFEDARREYEAAISGGRQTGENVIAALGLQGLASMALMNGLNNKAARLLGKVDDFIKELGYSYWLADRALREYVTDKLRKALPEAEFRREYDFGKTLTMEQAVAMALEDTVKVGAG